MYWLQHKLSTEDTLAKLSTSATHQVSQVSHHKRAWITSERLCSVAVCLVQRHKHQQTVHRRHTNATIIIIGRFIEGMEVHSIDYSTQLCLMRHSVIWRIFIWKWKNKKNRRYVRTYVGFPGGRAKNCPPQKIWKTFLIKKKKKINLK